MIFEKVEPYGPASYTYWICGIYKIVSYRRGEYSAFFIQDWFENWGDHVAPPPDIGKDRNKCWRSMRSAEAACRKHARNYEPLPKTIKRAAEIKAAMIQQGIDFHCPTCHDWFNPYGKCEKCEAVAA